MDARALRCFSPVPVTNAMADAELTITEHHLTVKRTARYYALGDGSAPVSDVWIVCHGFAQLARSFVEEFRAIARSGRLIVAPEALNRFYLNREGGRAGASARVGATWMTREDRLAEIDDYVRYLDDLFREVVGEQPRDVRITALGFSQAAATIARWLVHGASKLDRVVLWAGALPPEIDPAGAAHKRLASTELYMVLGRSDDLLDAAQIRGQRDALQKAGIQCRFIEYDGGHRLDTGTLQRLVPA
jgi:predicted esterase